MKSVLFWHSFSKQKGDKILFYHWDPNPKRPKWRPFVVSLVFYKIIFKFHILFQ